MQIAQQAIGAPRLLTLQEVDQVGGGNTFGEWVGRIAVWTSPVGLAADIITGGAVSNAAANAVGSLENWVNGK